MIAAGRTVYTVTLNPALDVAVSLEALRVGATNRADWDAFDPGGKGINVSRVLRRLGCEQLALGLRAGFIGEALSEKLREEGVGESLEQVPGCTRIDIMIYERAEHRPTRVYLPGAAATPDALQSVEVRLSRVKTGDLVVFGGSLPPGVADSIYARYIAGLAARGVRSIVDTSGSALALALAARPLLVKPNVEEASSLLGAVLDDDAAVLDAARELQRRGAQCVVISQGAAGAIGIAADGAAYKAIPPHVDAISTVGSGDSMVAGIAAALIDGRDFREGLRLGTACGAATAASAGTALCSRDDALALLESICIEALSPPLYVRSGSIDHERPAESRRSGPVAR